MPLPWRNSALLLEDPRVHRLLGRRHLIHCGHDAEQRGRSAEEIGPPRNRRPLSSSADSARIRAGNMTLRRSSRGRCPGEAGDELVIQADSLTGSAKAVKYPTELENVAAG